MKGNEWKKEKKSTESFSKCGKNGFNALTGFGACLYKCGFVVFSKFLQTKYQKPIQPKTIKAKMTIIMIKEGGIP